MSGVEEDSALVGPGRTSRTGTDAGGPTSTGSSLASGAARIEELAAALRESGLRLTHQRLEVVREIAGSPCHPDVEHIYGRVRARVPTISIDTVYRTLAALVDLGLVRRVNLGPGPVRYDPNTSRHHHFVCKCCGSIYDIDATGFAHNGPETADWVRATRPWGRVEEVEIQFRGICKECQRKGDGCG